ncbi:B3 domain-containing protein [Abeliophyllum distichum]|uniref:B3 domain-containing protein n=1 Tax=Abeliophyllum distichum TaxID=126358 RepID=A0ABD1P8J6_9LAMI
MPPVKRKRKMAQPVDSFFKFFNPMNSAERLKLPTAFSLQQPAPLPDRAFLRDKYRNLWPVKLSKVGEDWFFVDGWAKFIHDNSMVLGEFLVFKYDGDNIFDVKLLGHSGCDKKGVGGFRMSVKEETKDKGVEDEIDDSDFNSNDYMHVEDEEDEDAEYGQTEEAGVEEGEAEAEQVADDRPVQRRPDPFGEEIFRSGLAIRPRNPYFVAKLRKSRRNDLYIPKETIKDFNLNNLPEEMILIDPHQRQYQAKIIIWDDGRVWYRGGWKSICNVNFVREEDWLICEFVGVRCTMLASDDLVFNALPEHVPHMSVTDLCQTPKQQLQRHAGASKLVC